MVQRYNYFFYFCLMILNILNQSFARGWRQSSRQAVYALQMLPHQLVLAGISEDK
jgi:hypothetical protein